MAPSKHHHPETVKSAEIVMPSYTNNHGTMFGGKVLEMMDKLGAIAALRFTNKPFVTASFESIDFHQPIKQGDIVEMHAKVIFTGNTSLVVKIDCFSEPRLGGRSGLRTTGFIVFVTVDDHGRPIPLTPFKPKTPEEKRDWKIGKEVKESLLKRKRASLAR